jgi:hypothetical protein
MLWSLMIDSFRGNGEIGFVRDIRGSVYAAHYGATPSLAKARVRSRFPNAWPRVLFSSAGNCHTNPGNTFTMKRALLRDERFSLAKHIIEDSSSKWCQRIAQTPNDQSRCSARHANLTTPPDPPGAATVMLRWIPTPLYCILPPVRGSQGPLHNRPPSSTKHLPWRLRTWLSEREHCRRGWL